MNLYIGDQEKGAAANPFPWEQIQKNKMAEMAAFNQQMELENNFQKEERAINAKIYENMQSLNEKAIEFLPGDKQKFQAKYTELRDEFFKQVEPYSSVQAFYADGGAAKLSEFADNLLGSKEFGNGSHNAMQLKAYTQSLMTNPNTRPMQVVGKDGQPKFLAANEAIAEVMSGKADRFDFNGAYKTEIKMPPPTPSDTEELYTWKEYIDTAIAQNPGIDQNFIQDIVKMAGGPENLDKPSTFFRKYKATGAYANDRAILKANGGNGGSQNKKDYWLHQGRQATEEIKTVIDRFGNPKETKLLTIGMQSIDRKLLQDYGLAILKRSGSEKTGDAKDGIEKAQNMEREDIVVRNFEGRVSEEGDITGKRLVSYSQKGGSINQKMTYIDVINRAMKSQNVIVDDYYAIINEKDEQERASNVTTVAKVPAGEIQTAIIQWLAAEKEKNKNGSGGITIIGTELNQLLQYAGSIKEFEVKTFKPGQGSSEKISD